MSQDANDTSTPGASGQSSEPGSPVNPSHAGSTDHHYLVKRASGACILVFRTGQADEFAVTWPSVALEAELTAAPRPANMFFLLPSKRVTISRYKRLITVSLSGMAFADAVAMLRLLDRAADAICKSVLARHRDGHSWSIAARVDDHAIFLAARTGP